MALASDFFLGTSSLGNPIPASAPTARRTPALPSSAALASPSCSSNSLRRRSRRTESSSLPLDCSFLGQPLQLQSASPRATSPGAAAAPRAAASGFSARAGAESTVDLCVFPMRSLPLPTSTGSLTVFEPHLLALLQVIQHVAAATPGDVPARFGAMPYDWVLRQMAIPGKGKDDPPPSGAGGAHPSFLAASAAAGHLQFPDTEVTGCCCVVDAVLQELNGDSYFVKHRGVRRFRPVQILRRQPFLVVRGEWLNDVEEEEPSSGQLRGVDSGDSASAGSLELSVWGELQEVEALTARLAGQPEASEHHSMLPDAVTKFAPKFQDPQPLIAASPWVVPTTQLVQEVAVWRRMRSTPTAVTQRASPVHGPVLAPAPPVAGGVLHSHPAAASAAPVDPYWSACERLSRSARQEAFSFAAATVIDLGPEQHEALLSMTSTSERLQWVLKAIEPHLASLRAECALRKAMGDL